MSTRAIRFVVFASPKSGTTWLQRLLTAHPQVHCSETRLFGKHIDPSRPSGLGITLESYVSNIQRHFHIPASAAASEHRSFSQELTFDLADQIARTVQRISGKEIYGEKQTPYLGTATQVLDQLLEYDPGIRLISLVRDGRDVIVSGANQWHNLSPDDGPSRQGAREAGVEPKWFDMFAQHWVEAVTAVRAARHRFRCILQVRYEDMLQHTEQEAARVLEFIGADADPAVVARCVDAASFRSLSGGRRSGEEDPTSFFRKGTAGDWREKLSPSQVRQFEERCGELLTELGYALSTETEPVGA